jgi:hypothetical protein
MKGHKGRIFAKQHLSVSLQAISPEGKLKNALKVKVKFSL